MTCAKVRVRAILKLSNGHVYEGYNDCDNPQKTCPRLPGEGYEKCETICRQKGHAEVRAMDFAAYHGEDLRGSKMTVFYNRVCEDCQHEMHTEGVEWERQDA